MLCARVPLAVNVERRATSQLEASVIGNASTLAANSANLVAQAGGRPAVARRAPPELRRILKQATATEPGRVIVVDAEGRLLADSDGPAAGHVYATPQRPELGAVLASGRVDTRQRHSDTLGEDLLLVTVPVVDDKLVGALRVSRADGRGAQQRALQLASAGADRRRGDRRRAGTGLAARSDAGPAAGAAGARRHPAGRRRPRRPRGTGGPRELRPVASRSTAWRALWART